MVERNNSFSSFNWGCGLSKFNIPFFIDNIVYGACNTHSGNTRVPVKQLITVMAHLPELSTNRIQSMLSKRRIIKGDEVLGERYCRIVLTSCNTLIKSMNYYIDIGKLSLSNTSSFSFHLDSECYNKYRDSLSC